MFGLPSFLLGLILIVGAFLGIVIPFENSYTKWLLLILGAGCVLTGMYLRNRKLGVISTICIIGVAVVFFNFCLFACSEQYQPLF